jgi:acetyl-CoA C-acetyltransferase
MEVAILGTAVTKFGELWHKSLVDLAREAALEALKDARLAIKDIEAIFIGNMLAGRVEDQVHLGSLIGERLGFDGPTTRVEGACASGSMAVRSAVLSLLSGEYHQVLVIGAEKMTDYQSSEISEALMSAAGEEERVAGLTFPTLFALMARSYLERYQITEVELAAVSVKNHFHASLNGKAQYPFEVSCEQVLQSPKIAEPLKLLDCSPISDGAAAVVLAQKDYGCQVYPPSVSIIASVQASDSLSLSERKDLTRLVSVEKAAQKAFQMAGITPQNVDCLEVHDCFTIAEIMALEALGFYRKGEGWQAAIKKETYLGGKLPVNTSGGLKASGHPVAATGIKQIVEVADQLRNKAGKRQIKGAKIGLTQNIGGAGGTAVIHILMTNG